MGFLSWTTDGAATMVGMQRIEPTMSDPIDPNGPSQVSGWMNSPAAPPDGTRRRQRAWRVVEVATVLLLALVAALLWYEAQASRLQAWALSRQAAKLTFHVEPGPGDAPHFPTHGPFDERMGYTRLPDFTRRLDERGFEVSARARHSQALSEYLGHGFFAPYAEKTQAGLTVLDCRRDPLYSFAYPYRRFVDFDSVPPVVVQSLLFIENRDLLDPQRPQMNPAVDWVRFGRALLGQMGSRIHVDLDTPGGSTLATQMEKYRHSPDGVTLDAREKLRQMISAAVRAYQRGENTLPVRRQLVLDYLNTVPLSAAPRHGEVNGLGDGLWVWFGTDLARAQTLLASQGQGAVDQREQAQVLRQVVALMIAHRRPSWYLAQGRAELERNTDAHLRLLSAEGIVDPAMARAALQQTLVFRNMQWDPPLQPINPDKGSAAARNRLAALLDTSLYGLDRLDVRTASTLHGSMQETVDAYLGQLVDPAFAQSQGLVGTHLLQPGTLGEVRYSFTLMERTGQDNRVRVQTDTNLQPLDINEGSKLELGSTAKLRVLATYLEHVAELHARLSPLEPAALRKTPADPQDSLTRWAVQYLLQAKDRSLSAMLDAALERRFSADPDERFFTGGGVHTFSNFNPEDNHRVPTVREALQASINLPFVRLMRELVRHTLYQMPGGTAQLLKDLDDPRRSDYLARFADREGKTFLRRFWRKSDDQSADELRAVLLDGLRPTPDRLAAVFRYLEPDAAVDALGAFLQARLGEKAPDAARVAQLYERYAPLALDLPDRGYVAGVHPLELWLVGYRLQHPDATLADALEASAGERQAVYGWLFRTRVKSAQDTRIYTLLEVEAFLDIHSRGRVSAIPSVTWCRRWPPRWAARATALPRWPNSWASSSTTVCGSPRGASSRCALPKARPGRPPSRRARCPPSA